MSKTKVRERYDKNFERLLRGAAKVFYKKGYDRASIRDIARETGISLAGIYYYVSGKEEILFQIQKLNFEAVLRNLENRLDALQKPEDQLLALIENHLAYFVKNMREMKVLSHESDDLTGRYLRDIEAMKRDYVRRARDIIEKIGTNQKGRQVPPGTAALCLFGMMNWIYTWYDPRRDGSSKKLARTMQNIFLKGLKGSA